ncbi:MAG: nuclear transport factor 2 family protein [Gemmatimonadales bacterium]
MKRFLLSLLLCLLPATAFAQTDSAQVVAVIEQFHAALAGSDSAAAMALLAPDAVIIEGGWVETREGYAAGHLTADMAFLAGMTTEVVSRTVALAGDVAWVSTVSHTDGDYNGRSVNSRGAELMILGRGEGGWLIRAIHWSSGRR